MTEQEQMAQDCESRESRLSDWERSFIDNITRRLAQGNGLTTAQAERLEQVWEKATAQG